MNVVDGQRQLGRGLGNTNFQEEEEAMEVSAVSVEDQRTL